MNTSQKWIFVAIYDPDALTAFLLFLGMILQA
jgi:hypothetical protein